MTDQPTIEIPADAYARLVKVAQHVSTGRSFAFVGQGPYPDATARRALGTLADAGLLPSFATESGEQRERERELAHAEGEHAFCGDECPAP